MVSPTKGMPVARSQMPDPSDTFDSMPREKRLIQDLIRMSQMALDSRTPDDVARHRLLLLDPTGAAWELRISTTGVLTTTKLRG